jgi:L-fuculose-phosphate aldolase
MTRPEHAIRREVSDISRLIWERGWVANHDGNVTAKVAPGRIVATPTGLSKRVIDREALLVVDESGRVVRGRLRPFSELGMHLLVYRARPDVAAIVHAHPPYATARGMRCEAIPSFLPEAVVSIGEGVPVVPLAMPGRDSEDALEPFVREHDAVLIQGNGVFAWGTDVEHAYLRMELVEHLAHMAHITGVTPALPRDMVEKLLEKRAAAGLGPAGRR